MDKNCQNCKNNTKRNQLTLCYYCDQGDGELPDWELKFEVGKLYCKNLKGEYEEVPFPAFPA